jgi:hypothetical protein
MLFTDYQKAFSIPRLDAYLYASSRNQVRAIDAYKTNLRMSQAFLGALSIFEVTLRNEIDAHYKNQFGNNWLQTQASATGFLSARGCETSLKTVEDVILKFSRVPFNHNEAICLLGFGFWRYLFAVKEFRSAGNTLLRVFPNKPTGVSQGIIFNKLSDINRIRNRIAHHEPICFNYHRVRLSDGYARHNFKIILEMLQWMSYDTNFLFSDIYDFDREAVHLLSI